MILPTGHSPCHEYLATSPDAFPMLANPPADPIHFLLPSSRLTLPYLFLATGQMLDEFNEEDILKTISTLTVYVAVTGAIAFIGGSSMVRNTKGGERQGAEAAMVFVCCEVRSGSSGHFLYAQHSPDVTLSPGLRSVRKRFWTINREGFFCTRIFIHRCLFLYETSVLDADNTMLDNAVLRADFCTICNAQTNLLSWLPR